MNLMKKDKAFRVSLFTGSLYKEIFYYIPNPIFTAFLNSGKQTANPMCFTVLENQMYWWLTALMTCPLYWTCKEKHRAPSMFMMQMGLISKPTGGGKNHFRKCNPCPFQMHLAHTQSFRKMERCHVWDAVWRLHSVQQDLQQFPNNVLYKEWGMILYISWEVLKVREFFQCCGPLLRSSVLSHDRNWMQKHTNDQLHHLL